MPTGGLTEVSYEVPVIERPSGGTSHREIAETIADLVAAAQHDKPAPLSVVADITVPGEPFLNLLRVLKCELRGS